MEEHKSNILELLHCFDLTEEQDFREMSRKFKEGSSLLAGTAVTFGTVFLLLELLKEVKELKNFFMDKDKPKELDQQIQISGNLKGTPEEMKELMESTANFLHSRIKEESTDVGELKELSSELHSSQKIVQNYAEEVLANWINPEETSPENSDNISEVSSEQKSFNSTEEVKTELENKGKEEGVKTKSVVKKPVKKSTKPIKTTSKLANKKSPKVE